MGVLSLADALNQARSRGVDLVEVAPNATPPVCRLVDFGKYKYELEKRQKEGRKHQHANKVKEIQLSATIDPHDFDTKLSHAIDFLCEDMKVKASLRFRGREMAHTEFGFQVVRRFLQEVGPWGHPDFEPKLNGRSINVMISPLPRNKRAKHPDEGDEPGARKPSAVNPPEETPSSTAPAGAPPSRPPATNAPRRESEASPAKGPPPADRNPGFSNNPFEGLKIGSPGADSRE